MTISRNRQNSGVSWLGDLPDTWSAVPLKQRTTLVSRGRSPDYSEDEKGVPIINQACVYWDGIRYDKVKWQRRETLSGERGRVRPGDLLMNSTGTGTLGRVAVFDRSDGYLADSHVTVIRATKDAVPSFLRYVLQTGIYQGYVYSVLAPGATNQIELSREGLRRTPFPMPPVDEQRAIASFLDRKTAAIDAFIAKKERLIELLQEKRQALITQAVTKGLDPNVPMKESGIPWIGKVPSHWKIVAVKRTATPGRKTFTDGDWIESPFITEQGVRLIQTGNVGIGRYKEQGFRYISEQTFGDLRCTEVDPGDVLICRLDGPVGRACLAPHLGVRMITSVDNAILKPCSDCDGRYLVYVLSSPKYLDWVQVLCRVGGGFRFRVSRSMLGDIQIPVPPGDEQRQIADLLDEQTQRSVAVEAKLEAHCDKLRDYRQALITAAVTGKIDVSGETA